MARLGIASWLPKVSPWIISTGLHLAILLVLISAWSVGRRIIAGEGPARPILNPNSFWNPDGGQPGGSLHPGDDPIGEAARNMTRLPTNEGWDKVNGDVTGIIKGTGGASAADALIRGGAAAGVGTGTGGGLAAIGTPGGGGLGNGPKVTFYG